MRRSHTRFELAIGLAHSGFAGDKALYEIRLCKGISR